MVFILPQIQKEPSIGERLGSGLGRGISQGSQLAMQMASQRQRNKAEEFSHQMKTDQIKSALKSRGVSDEDADLYANLTVGGQTEFVKNLLESQKRASKVPEMDREDQDIRELVESQDQGMTPAERVKSGAKRYETGLPIFKESIDKLHEFRQNDSRFKILGELSQTGKLPSGLGRINVDKSGNLRFPAAASKEAQRFVKTFNEAASGAKGTYGSRVTNFDLEQYMKQFPSLANTPEAMSEMIEQLKIVNDINKVYYKNLSDIFKKAGGARKIDSDLAISLAEERTEPQIAELVKRFDDIGKTNTLDVAMKKFPARENQGKRLRNPETGEVLISDGVNWISEE